MAFQALSGYSEQEFAAYRSALLWSTQEFRSWPKAQTLPSGIRLALAWAHAHQIFVCFKALGSPMEWIQECFETFSNRVRFGSVDLESSLRADVSHPVHLTRATLLLGGLHYAYGPSEDLPFPGALADRFAELALMNTEIGRLPSVPLLMDSRLAEDQLGGFLGGDRQAKLVSMLPERDLELVQAILKEASAEGTFAGLDGHNQEAGLWVRLYAVLGGFAVPPDFAQRLARVILKTDFVSMAAHDPERGYVGLHVACMQSRNVAEEGVRRHLTEALLATAALFAKKNETAKSKDVALVFLECALSVAQCVPPNGRIMDEFAAITDRLTRIWKVVAEVARRGIQRMCEEVPFSESDHLWRLNLMLRSRT